MERWGERLRGRAKELGLTDADVARRLGLTQGRYSTYVNMTREPDFATLVRICKALQTTPDEVLGFAQARRDAVANPPMVRAVGVLTLLDSEALAEAAEVLEVIARHRAGRFARPANSGRATAPERRARARAATESPPLPTPTVVKRAGRAVKPDR